MDHNRRIGNDGEAATAAAYERAGYEVLDRNWRCPDGELDLVLSRGGTVVFCEVKTRTSARFGDGAEAVDRRRQARLRAAALAWLAARGARFGELRFDVAVVAWGAHGGRVEVIEYAF